MSRRSVQPLLLLLLLLCAAAFWWAVDPAACRFAPQCPFRLLTGWSCPACGLQRAAHALLHGHPVAALRYNFFFLFSLPYATGACLAAWLPSARWRGRLARVCFAPWMLWTYVALFCAWGVVRNCLGI